MASAWVILPELLDDEVHPIRWPRGVVSDVLSLTKMDVVGVGSWTGHMEAMLDSGTSLMILPGALVCIPMASTYVTEERVGFGLASGSGSVRLQQSPGFTFSGYYTRESEVPGSTA